LGVSEDGVRKLIRRGVLPAAKIGRRWYVRREAFEREIARLERAARPARGPGETLLRLVGPQRRRRTV
jgi:excisionase family DNA binding protein